MKVITWNVNSVRVREPHIKNILDTYNPSVLMLQETKVKNKQYPVIHDKYIAAIHGQKQTNGVSIHAKRRGSDIHYDPLSVCDNARIIASTYGPFRFVNVYVPNGAKDINAYIDKLVWMKEFIAYIMEERRKYKYMIIAGDFNVCPSDHDIYDPKAWAGSVSCTKSERQWYSDLLSIGFKDVMYDIFDSVEYTCWDYRNKAFEKDMGMRIDHVLVSENLTPNVASYEVLKSFRSLDRPSDHAPLLVTIEK